MSQSPEPDRELDRDPGRDLGRDLGREQRLALVLARHGARPPDGVDAQAFADACLTDSYEVVAELAEMRAGVVWPDERSESPERSELLWPGDVELTSAEGTTRALAAEVQERWPEVTQLILVPADVPDLPGLVLAKVARALLRADVCCAPEVGGDGLAALGLRVPVAGWLREVELDLDHDPGPALARSAPNRTLVARGPGWRRLRTPHAAAQLNPRLEGWDHTRLLLDLF